ncbi:MAG TPA: thioredoxin domain-containing protein [Bryobacteraceae bacterium]|nr:thioredoxin domain-containing protein [Bryobacteraceae bacterium]
MRNAAIVVAIGLTLANHGAFAARTDVIEGNTGSSVRLLVYEDLQCDDCARFEAMLEQKILPKYSSKIVIVHRDFPLAKHDWARQAAMAARWVWQQDSVRGIQIRRELLSEQDHITSANLNTWLADFAGRNHLDPKAIVDSLKDPNLSALIDQDRQAAVARGVTGTPTAYIGGVAFKDPIIYEDLARALDDALAK